MTDYITDADYYFEVCSILRAAGKDKPKYIEIMNDKYNAKITPQESANKYLK